MASLIDTFVPFDIYNSLPHIEQVATTLDDHSEDLNVLRQLLTKHEILKDVSIRLIHKHFDIQDGEVMVFSKVDLPYYGTIQTMKPVLPSPDDQKLRGINYFANDQGSVQAYEYAECEVPDMEKFACLLQEFCGIVTERRLRHRFGLKLKVEDELDRISWTEFEFHEKRSTIMLQEGMPMPEGTFDHVVSTEWNSSMIDDDNDSRTCKHKKTCRHGPTVCSHCTHCSRHERESRHDIGDDGRETIFYLGGQRIVPGTSIFGLINAIAVQAF